jgi:hypothetical protein
MGMRLSYRNRGQIGLRATPVAKPSPMQRLRLYSACWLSRHRTPGRFVQYAAPHCAARMAHASNMWSSATRPASLDQGLCPLSAAMAHASAASDHSAKPATLQGNAADSKIHQPAHTTTLLGCTTHGQSVLTRTHRKPLADPPHRANRAGHRQAALSLGKAPPHSFFIEPWNTPLKPFIQNV